MNKPILQVGLFFISFVLLSWLVIFVGQDYIPLSFSNNELFLITEIRLPKYFAAILIGVVFSTAGLIMQLFFKNDLATPYTLGISSGSILFIILGLKLGIDFKFLIFHSSIFLSSVGALFIFFLLFKISSSKNNFLDTILLIGIGLNIFFSSAMMLIQYFSNMTELYHITHWLVGSIEINSLYNYIPTTISFILSTILIFREAPSIDLLSVNTQLATDRGIDIRKITLKIFFMQAITLGTLLPFTGPIAFVGLIIPNIVRLFVKKEIKYLYITTAVIGVNFMLFVHFISMRIKGDQIIPIGIITSILGAIFLVISLTHSNRENY